jgi:hypothetical protein
MHRKLNKIGSLNQSLYKCMPEVVRHSSRTVKEGGMAQNISDGAPVTKFHHQLELMQKII